MSTNKQKKEAAQYEQRKIRCLEEMASGWVIPEVVGSIETLTELLEGGYAQVVRKYNDKHYKCRDIGITDKGREYLAELQAKPKDYIVGPQGGVIVRKARHAPVLAVPESPIAELQVILDITVPRALLVLCHDLLNTELIRRVYSSPSPVEDDYELTMAQLRAHLNLPPPDPEKENND